MNTHMDPTFTTALRSTLVDQVTRSRASSRRRRWRRGGAGLLALAAIGGGTAYAAGAFQGLPGSDAVTQVAPARTVTGDGTQSVNLGRPPASANSIEIRFTCLTAGTFTFADGASITCTQPDLGTRAAVVTYTLPVQLGHTTTIATSPGNRWRLTVSYAKTVSTAWEVNTHGRTYGVANTHGTPDLIATIATNGKLGYVDAQQLAHAEGPTRTSPRQALAEQARAKPVSIEVYQSDGTTVIGHFIITPGTG